MRTRFLDVDGLSIAVHERGGDGRTVVLLHGNSVSSRTFQRQFEGRLGASVRLIAIDFPGHGMSSAAPDAVYSLPGLARVLVHAARQLGVLDATFVGWSLGGHVLLEASRDLPDAAGFVVFGAPPLRYPLVIDGAFHPHPIIPELAKAELTEAEIEARAASMLRADAPIPSLFLEEVRKSDSRFRPALFDSFQPPGFADEVDIVAALRQPLLVLHGAFDQIANLDYIRGLTMPSLWRGEVRVLPNAGHAAHWEDAAEFDDAICEFVAAVAT